MRRLLVAGTVAILAFATIGQFQHDHHVSLGGYAADALPLLAGWWAFAFATRRFVPTWFGGVTVGVAIRAVALGHYRWNQLTFLLVALAFVGLFALIAFLAQTFTERRMSHKRAE
jgi:Protein of unknown function (DUF3054).